MLSCLGYRWQPFENFEVILVVYLDDLAGGHADGLCRYAFAAHSDEHAVEVQGSVVEPRVSHALLQALFRPDGLGQAHRPECFGNIPPTQAQEWDHSVGVVVVADHQLLLEHNDVLLLIPALQYFERLVERIDGGVFKASLSARVP